jgi:hypothetical protein
MSSLWAKCDLADMPRPMRVFEHTELMLLFLPKEGNINFGKKNI